MLYPKGYSYEVPLNSGGYVEMRASWIPESTTMYKVTFRDTINQDVIFEPEVPACKIALPSADYGNDRFCLVGWSQTKYDPGQGTASYTDTVDVSGIMTLYPVYERIITEYSLIYHGNG